MINNVWSLIACLQDLSFPFYNLDVPNIEEIDEEARSDMAVKTALREEFELNCDQQKSMEDAMSLKLQEA